MHAELKDILAWERKYRLKFINALSGYKGVYLIGTRSSSGRSNLAIFNSLVHLGSDPPYLGFIMRPHATERHTLENIQQTGVYTVNHVHKSFLKKAHYTSAKFDQDVSEFEACNLEEQFIGDFEAPFVGESKVKFGLKLKEIKKIELNGTMLVIGEIQTLHIDDGCVLDDGGLDLQKVHNVVVTGLDQYSSVSKFMNLPYARAEEAPNFRQKERPDNVVFDEESQNYNANILPYGTNIGAPSIVSNNISAWKNSSVSKFNHSFNNKIEEVKRHYQQLVDEFRTNEIVYGAKMNFEPVIGQEYHLYQNDSGENFLSLIPPGSWNKEYLGTFRLNHEQVWQKVSE